MSNTLTAEQQIEATATADYLSTIGVDADTALAAAVILAFVTRERTAIINTELQGIAEATAALNGLTAPVRVPVDVYIRSIPTNSEITSRIGTVRVPVDAYTRSTPRVNGAPV